MAQARTVYVCQSCGAGHAKWAGRCDACGAWNSLVEEKAIASRGSRSGGAKRAGGHGVTFVPLEGEQKRAARYTTGIGEFDRVTGGGLVPGSAILVGGDPGIGKSTLLLQAAAGLAARVRTAYISGEEAIDQVRMRAERLGLAKAGVQLAAATSVADIVASLDATDRPDVAIIDSIQTMSVEGLESAPGTVAQVRASAHELTTLAKRRGFAVILVGHVTKEGMIAGPRVLEHMVDAVLYFEGESSQQFRILRAVKNRFGATNEIGVFEMTGSGLAEVTNPSSLFLSERAANASGTAVFAGLEGSRPLLVEFQALVSPSALPQPRRTVVGWDSGRLAMILAVLEARCGVSLSGHDVYLNVAGGLRITEPAADLAVAAALVSAASGESVPPETVIFGEIALSGEVRAVAQTESRLREAAKLGFTKALAARPGREGGSSPAGMTVERIAHLRDLVGRFPIRRRRAPEAAGGERVRHG